MDLKEKLIFSNKNKPKSVILFASFLFVISFSCLIGTFLLPDDFFFFKIFKRHALVFLAYLFYFFGNKLATFYTIEIDYKNEKVTLIESKLLSKNSKIYSSLPEYISLNGNLLSFDMKIWLEGNQHFVFSKSYEYNEILNLSKKMAKLLEVDIFINIEKNDKHWLEYKDL